MRQVESTSENVNDCWRINLSRAPLRVVEIILLYQSVDPKTTRDLWVIPREKDTKPQVFLKTEFHESMARFSPDGRWVAYQSNESGRI
jgi:WD40 repeat protein